MKPINFTRGVPAANSFPPAEELLDATRAALAREDGAALQYGAASGLVAFREWLAEWQGVDPDQVMSGNGSLELIEFLCRQMLKPGDVVFTESPSYDRAINLFRRHEAQIIGIPLQPDGPDIEALERALAERVPTLFYLIPDFQNPAGVTCSAEKRRHIVALAERYGFYLLEDAPYRLLRYKGREEPTLFSLAPHRVLHMSSFTKLIAPGFRVGFMLGDPELLRSIAKVAEDTYISPGYFAQAVANEWCRRGLLEPQVARLKALYRPRLEACKSAIQIHLSGAEATSPEGGFFVSLNLPEGVSTAAVRSAAASRNLNLADGLAFFPNGGGDRFLRLPYCALTPEEIDEGIRRLADTVRTM